MKAPKNAAGNAAPRSASSPTGLLRPWVALLPFVAALLAIAAVHRNVSGRLPDPLATHFGADGRADGYSTVQGFLTGCLSGLVVLGAGCVVWAALRRTTPPTRWVITGGWGFAVMLAYPACLTLLGNARAADAAAARMPMWQLAAALGVAVLAAGLGWLLAGPDAHLTAASAAAAPRLPLTGSEHAGWTRTVHARWLTLLGVLAIAGGVVAGFLGNWRAGGPVAACGLPAVLLSAVRVTVDRRGLTLTSGVLPVPFRRVRLDRVVEAVSRDVAAVAEFGGWGYRVRPGRSGLVFRSGEGLALRLTSGREFVVTVDDAATAAALFNAYLDRARPQQGG